MWSNHHGFKKCVKIVVNFPIHTLLKTVSTCWEGSTSSQHFFRATKVFWLHEKMFLSVSQVVCALALPPHASAVCALISRSSFCGCSFIKSVQLCAYTDKAKIMSSMAAKKPKASTQADCEFPSLRLAELADTSHDKPPDNRWFTFAHKTALIIQDSHAAYPVTSKGIHRAALLQHLHPHSSSVV